MKKILSLICIAAAAMAFTGCSTEDATQDPAPEARKVTLSITADNSGTRTVIDENNKISWTENDAIEVLEKSANGIEFAASTNCSLTAGKASFSVTLPANTSGDLTYAAVYPASAFISENYSDITKIKTDLPGMQTPTAASFDPAADLMISQAVQKTAQPTTDGISFSFARVAALAKMTITNLGLAEGENVRQVSFAAPDKKLAGRSYLDLATGKVVEFGYSNVARQIVLDYSAVTGIDKASFPVWFACLPCDLAANDTFTVVVTSDKNKTYTKSITLIDGQSISFGSGQLSTFTVNMSGIAGESIASDARVATLTFSEVSELGMAYTTPVDYINSTGMWTIAASKQNSMQINGNNGYIKLPVFKNDISLVKITTNALSASRSLMLNKENSTSGAAVSQSQETGSTSFVLNAAGTDLKTGYVKSSGVVQITNIQVFTGATIYPDEIPVVPAAGVIDAKASYQTISFTGEDDTAVFDFNDIVTAASVDPAAKTLTYTVSGNTTGAERTGSIKLHSPSTGAEISVNITQAADKFEINPTAVTLGGDANATVDLTLTSDFEVGTPTVSAPDKFKVEAGTDGKYTVTALADGGSEETELGTITFTRTIDNKRIVVTVKQAAKGASGYTEYWKDDFSNATGNASITTLSGSTNGYSGNYSGFSKAYACQGAVKIGSASAGGSITTPALSNIPAGETADLKITLKAEGWNKKTPTLTLKANNAGTVEGGAQNITASTTMQGTTPYMSPDAPTYTFTVTGATQATTITISSGTAAVGIDDLLIATN